MASETIAISGMTCAACEETVVAAALAVPGVTAAKASAKNGRLTVSGPALPSRPAFQRQFTEQLAGFPYALGERAWLTKERAVWRDVAIAVAAVAVLAIVAVAANLDAGIASLTARASTGSALFIVGLGVAASVSTCMALVGGLVISLAASASARGEAKGWARVRPHALFNAGRIVGFGGLGALVGLAGNSLALEGWTLALTLGIVAVVMALLGVRLTGISPRLAAWQLALPSSWGRWARTGRDVRRDGAHSAPTGLRSDARAALLGAATFFLPCGFTQAVQVYALSTGSAWQGATVMALFAVGTTPGLMAAGLAASVAKGKGAVRALRYVGVAVVAFAGVTAGGALATAVPGLWAGDVAATERTANVHDEAGVQVVTTAVLADGYSPASAVVYVGEPVRWVLSPVGFGCAALIDASELGVADFIAVMGEDDVVVEFTPTEAGTYGYQCAMGMYTGSFTAIERPTID